MAALSEYRNRATRTHIETKRIEENLKEHYEDLFKPILDDKKDDDSVKLAKKLQREFQEEVLKNPEDFIIKPRK